MLTSIALKLSFSAETNITFILLFSESEYSNPSSTLYTTVTFLTSERSIEFTPSLYAPSQDSLTSSSRPSAVYFLIVSCKPETESQFAKSKASFASFPVPTFLKSTTLTVSSVTRDSIGSVLSKDPGPGPKDKGSSSEPSEQLARTNADIITAAAANKTFFPKTLHFIFFLRD